MGQHRQVDTLCGGAHLADCCQHRTTLRSKRFPVAELATGLILATDQGASPPPPPAPGGRGGAAAAYDLGAAVELATSFNKAHFVPTELDTLDLHRPVGPTFPRGGGGRW